MSSREPASSPRPGAKGYFQPFSISGSPTLGNEQQLSLIGPDGKAIKGEFKTDFSPLAIGVGATLDHVPIVFAGYGITAKDEGLKLDYDDYAGIDVKGKAVSDLGASLSRRTTPVRSTARKRRAYATFQHKATNAFQHGAVAVLLVNDLAGLGDQKDELLPFDSRRRPRCIPTFRS